MAGIKALVGLAFAGCVGLTFLVLACTIPANKVWWPLFVLTFYILAPIPMLISKRYQDDMSSSSACTEFSLFVTTGIVVSAFGLPIILTHAQVIAALGLLFTLIGNVVIFCAILAYFYITGDDDEWGNSLF